MKKDIKSKIRDYFFLNPSSKKRVRELERTLSLPLPSVIRYCKELKKENLLDTQTIGKVTLYIVNRDDEYFFQKMLYNLMALRQSGLIEHLRRELSNPNIILFGSYSKGADVESSDIDLYVETAAIKELNLDEFKKLLHREIQIFRFKHISEINNKHLANNILNGITLNGQVEVFR